MCTSIFDRLPDAVGCNDNLTLVTSWHIQRVFLTQRPLQLLRAKGIHKYVPRKYCMDAELTVILVGNKNKLLTGAIVSLVSLRFCPLLSGAIVS